MQVANGIIVAALDINHDMFVRGGDLKFTERSRYRTGFRCAILLETGHGITACCLVRAPVVLQAPPVSARRVPPGTESLTGKGLALAQSDAGNPRALAPTHRLTLAFYSETAS
jgi:hypothetical protein